MSFFEQEFISEIQNVYRDKSKNICIDLKREDKIHPLISGNKFRKLKYNLEEAKNKNFDCVLTYGGAFSNHIIATAVACKIYGLKSIGVIRGEEIEEKLKNNPNHNPTLAKANEEGMQLHFISRNDYSKKDKAIDIEKLENKFGDFYRIPEGGTNELAVKGCEEILNKEDEKYDIITCCVGTGGTISGIINSSKKHQKLLGFSALKNHQHSEIKNYTNKNNYQIIEDEKFGGYAKTNEKLVKFINSFYCCTQIKLDPIYTGKMMYKLFEMIQLNQIPQNTSILAIHSGGIQCVEAFNNFQKSKNRMPIVFQ